MAMICKTGGSECSGCMGCESTVTDFIRCECCRTEIYDRDECYKVGDDYYCDECVHRTVWKAG
jgi:hypothetical protein